MHSKKQETSISCLLRDHCVPVGDQSQQTEKLQLKSSDPLNIQFGSSNDIMISTLEVNNAFSFQSPSWHIKSSA